jgi:6-phosphogluconate dehydrogenase
MKIAVQGLGRMGMQIAQKLAESDNTLIALNRSPDKVDQAVTFGAVGAYSKEDVLKAFGDDQVILWIMLPAEVVDEEVDAWLTMLPKGSIFIDGGNSDYRLTQKLNEKLKAAGMDFLDVGTSGGVWGYDNGFCMMAGGDNPDVFALVEPALKVLAAPEGAYHHFGPSGAGHFVKMTHNAIEYGIMESLAEGYQVLKEGPYKDLNLGAAGEVWQHHSVITSWLNELSRDALQESPELEGIEGIVAESGEARWTLETAKELNLPMPSIQAAFDVRIASQQGQVDFRTKLLAAQRNKFGGHNLQGGPGGQ